MMDKRAIHLALLFFLTLMPASASTQDLSYQPGSITARRLPSTAGGDSSAVTIGSGAHAAASARTLADWAKDRVSVADYVAAGRGIGGGISEVLLRSREAGDTIALLPGTVGGWAAGDLLTCSCLPAGTKIAAVSAPADTVVTYATTAASAYVAGFGINMLTIPSKVGLPVGASVSGSGISPDTVVIATGASSRGTQVFLNRAFTSQGVQQGANISFRYTTTMATLSAPFASSALPDQPVGITPQDDYPTFISAAYRLAPEHGGQGGTIFVPSGTYFLSTGVGSYSGVSWEFGTNVIFLPGSQSIDALVVPNVQQESAATFASDARNPADTTVTITQQLFQPLLPIMQQQALLIHQSNVNCIGSPAAGNYGCGEIGVELQQDMAPSITQGVIWGYHAVLYQRQGQKLAGSLAELEWNNSSGNDEPDLNQLDSVLGLHIDQIGTTPGTAGVKFGGNAAGFWHVGLACDSPAVHDWCVAVYNPASSTSTLSDVISGLRPDGSILAQSGQIKSSPVRAVTAPVSVSAGDCGTTIRDSSVSPHSVTIPRGLPVGCSIELIQGGQGSMTFVASKGVRAEEYSAKGGPKFTTIGPYARSRVFVDSSTTFLLSGDVR